MRKRTPPGMESSSIEQRRDEAVLMRQLMTTPQWEAYTQRLSRLIASEAGQSGFVVGLEYALLVPTLICELYEQEKGGGQG